MINLLSLKSNNKLWTIFIALFIFFSAFVFNISNVNATTTYGSWVSNSYLGSTHRWRAQFSVGTATCKSGSCTIAYKGLLDVEGGSSVHICFYKNCVDGTLVAEGDTRATYSSTSSACQEVYANSSWAVKSYTHTTAQGCSAKSVASSWKIKVSSPSAWAGTSTATGTSVSIPALPRYTITYNANGGANAPATNTGSDACGTNKGKSHGKAFTLASAVPTKEGYTFAGWNTKADGTGTNYAAGGTYSANAKLDLYAKWTGCSYTVSFNANGGSGTMNDLAMVYGTPKNLTTNSFTRASYIFTGWNTVADGSGVHYDDGESVDDLTTTCNGTVTLYAQWDQKPTHTLTANANGGVMSATQGWTIANSSSATKTIVEDYPYGALPVPTRTGYTFLGWYSAQTSGTEILSTTVVTSSSPTTIYAHWQANPLDFNDTTISTA